MSIIRRSLMALIASAVALTAFASSAMATNPTFPHKDYDPGDWTSTLAWATYGPNFENECRPELNWDTHEPLNSCPVTLSSEDWKFNYGGGRSYAANCGLELSAEVKVDGTLTVTNASVSGSEYVCKSLQPVSLPWNGSICSYMNTGEAHHEFWYRLDPKLMLGVNPVQGETFGLMEGAYFLGAEWSADIDSVDFDWASFGDGGKNGLSHDGIFGLGQETLSLSENVGNDYLPENCGWPELS